MVNVGIIGLGPVWETRYAPVLKKLCGRIRVCAVYDPVASRAQQAAADFDAEPSQGMLALLERPDVKAVLLLGCDWHGRVPHSFILASRKPAYISGSLGEDLQLLGRLHESALANGLTLMPEFSWRYTPATGRLQELLATRLGRPRRICIEAVAPRPEDPQIVPGQGPGVDFLVGLFDWCRYILRAAPQSLQAAPASPGPEETGGDCRSRAITIAFRATAGDPPVAELRIHEGGPAGNGASNHCSPAKFQVTCERGEAVLESVAQISWSGEAGTATESLVSERSTVEVMLDHFCRRVVGGLIPVADVADACRSIHLAQAVEQSLRTGLPIPLNGLELRK
jgi:predicted dehydrogenase